MGWHAWTRCQVPWGLAVYMLETRSEVKNVGFLLVIGVVILDAMVWGPVLLNGDVLPNQSFFESKFSICHLHLPALQSGLASLVFGLGDGVQQKRLYSWCWHELSACVWGENYWLMGNWTAERLHFCCESELAKTETCLALPVTSRPQFLKQVDNVDHFYKGHRQRSMLQECSEESQPQVIQVSFLQWPCWLAMSPLTC